MLCDQVFSLFLHAVQYSVLAPVIYLVWWSGLSLHLKPHFECSGVVDNSFPHLECVVWWVDLACI